MVARLDNHRPLTVVVANGKPVAAGGQVAMAAEAIHLRAPQRTRVAVERTMGRRWVASTGSGGEPVQVLSYRAGRGLVRWAGRWVMSHSSRDAGQLNWCDHSIEISEPEVGGHDWACVVSLGPDDAVETEVGPLSELLRKYA